MKVYVRHDDGFDTISIRSYDSLKDFYITEKIDEIDGASFEEIEEFFKEGIFGTNGEVFEFINEKKIEKEIEKLRSILKMMKNGS